MNMASNASDKYVLYILSLTNRLHNRSWKNGRFWQRVTSVTISWRHSWFVHFILRKIFISCTYISIISFLAAITASSYVQFLPFSHPIGCPTFLCQGRFSNSTGVSSRTIVSSSTVFIWLMFGDWNSKLPSMDNLQ